MFERFTPDASRVAVLAREEALATRHGWSGTEHIWLGVANGRSDPGAVVLARPRLDAPEIRAEIVRRIGTGGAFDVRDEEALLALGIDLDEVRRAAEDAFGPGALERPPLRGRRGRCDGPRDGGRLPFSPRAKKSIELALRWATTMRAGSIGTEHLLLGLVANHDGLAAVVLRDRGIGTDEIRAAIDVARDDAAS